MIFVKLWQFDLADRSHVRIDTAKSGAVEPAGRPGIMVTPLFDDGQELVRLERWAPGTAGRVDAVGGGELLVVEGSASESGDALRPQSWVRVPDGGTFDVKAGKAGAVFWLKTGHLRHITAPEA